jgi:O-antigen/teichoic acid export membrane protein
MFSLSYAVVPIYAELYVREGKQATEAFLARCLNYYLMAVIPLCVGYAAVSHDALVTLASHKYAAAAGFSPIVLTGLVFLGMNSMLYAGLYLQKKTGQILAVMLCAVATNVAANILLVPRYGATGAAVATLVACMVSSTLMVVLSRRHLRVTIPVTTIVYYSAASAVMYFVIIEIDTGHPWLNLIARIPLGVIIVAAAMLGREKEIRAQVWRFTKSASAKLF